MSWRSIVKGRDAVKECLRWNLGDGADVDLLKDPWMSNLPLFAFAYENAQNLPDMKVTEDIKAIAVVGCGEQKNQLLWSGSKGSSVTVKEAYNYLVSKKMGNFVPNMDWRYLWKLK